MFGVILLPDFALQAALRHQPGCFKNEPVALLDEGTSAKPVILQSNAAARAIGVQQGMTSSQGLARCSSLRLLTRSPVQETTISEALLEIAFSCSPWVEATAEGVCTFELRGSRPDDKKLCERVIAHLSQLDVEARIGLAANPDLALLAAHAAKRLLVVADSHSFLADLPITVLHPNSHALSVLHKWGIATLGVFSALPRQEVTRRLGAEGQMLWDRAAGRQERLLRLASMPVQYEEGIEFEYDVATLEPLLFILRRFLDQLVLRLDAIYRVPSSLHLRLRFGDDRTYSRSFSIPAPTNNVETLFRVLHTHLENFTASAPICSLYLAAIPALPLKEQFGLFETALRNPNGFGATLARLYATLDRERAGVACLEDSHRPDAFHMEAPDFLHVAETPVDRADEPPVPPTFGLPLRRLRPPVAVQVDVSHKVPIRIASGVIDGQVRASRGPYQLVGGWWEPASWAREEWDVELVHGGLHRLSRQPSGWFLEGTYD